MTEQRTYFLKDEATTLKLGEQIATHAEQGTVIYLQGNLGMGKTTLTRGVIQSMGHQGSVKSPTYTLVEPYQTDKGMVYHFDLYRLGDPEELEYMGIRDYFDHFRLMLVEWPEMGRGILPEPDMQLALSKEEQGRRIHYEPLSPKGKRLADSLGMWNNN